MTNQQIKITQKVMGMLAVIPLLIIFRDTVFSLVDKVIIPITEKVMQESYVVLVLIVLFVVSLYLAEGLFLFKKNYYKYPRYSLIIVAITIAFYSIFRFSNHYTYYGIGRLKYVDVAFASIIILETLTYFLPRVSKSQDVKQVVGFVSDTPSIIDRLGRSDYAELLINKIISTYKSGGIQDGALTILLNEKYGAGKTTFFNLLDQSAKGRIKTCVFKPWQTDGSDRMTEELLRLLEEQYSIFNQLGEQIEGYAKLLSGGEAKNVLEYVLHKQKERGSLASRYDSIKSILKVINIPLLVLVDDVDRLQTEELFALLKLLRNGADFPNIVYLVAADKDAMSQQLETRGIKNGEEYLKKFFNFELLFPIDDSYLNYLLREQVGSTLKNYYPQRISIPSVEDQFLSNKVVKDVFRSPRDVYRYINLLSYSLDICKRYDVLDELNVVDFLKLQLIQFISPMVYKILRDEKSLLLDTRSSDGRIYLKDKCQEIIRLRQSKTPSQKIASVMNRSNNHQQDENNHTEKITLFELPTHERRNNEDMVSDLLWDLFSDRNNYQRKDRICYEAEYFKFFAGKYSNSEFSFEYFKDLMRLSDVKFDKALIQTVEQGKLDFLLHKFKQYIEENRLNLDIPMALQRCLKIHDVAYKDYVQSQSHYVSPKDFCEFDKFSYIYRRLLTGDRDKFVTETRVLERIKSIYANNKQYHWLAYSLAMQDLSIVDGNGLILEMKKNLIRRFIKEELSMNPFEREKLEAIPMLKEMYSVYWEEKFKAYIKECQEPMAWLYILFEPYGSSLRWSVVAYHNLVYDYGLLDTYANSLELDLSPEISKDLTLISTPNYLKKIDETVISLHPFLIEAKKWWDNRLNCSDN